MTLDDFRALTKDLDGRYKIGFYDGDGGYTVATKASIPADDLHAPTCDCNCIGVCIGDWPE